MGFIPTISSLSCLYKLSLVKPMSQIHRFHLRLGYDALTSTACFLVISVGGRTAPLLPQYCSSSFFHAAGAPIKAPASFNFSLKFSECRRRAVKKNASQVVERWLYGALTGTTQLFPSTSTIFLPLYGTDCLCAPARRPKGNRSASHVPLEGGRPCWRVWRAPGRGLVGHPSVPQLWEKGVQQPPSGGCWLLGTISWKTYNIALKPCVFSCIIWFMMFLQNSKLFIKFTMSDDFFRGTAWGIGLSEVVPCGDRAAAYIVEAASIQVLAGDRWEKRKLSGRRKWCTTAAARLAVPMPGWAIAVAGLHSNGDICGAFLPR
jgi:hypothetical protein